MHGMFNRVILIIMDGLGVGELPDAAYYGDVGSHTLGNMARAVGGMRLPNLAALGLGRLGDFHGIDPNAHRSGAVGKMAERSRGKDTTTGHWEMMGLVVEEPFPVYPDGFPAEVIEPFKKIIGREILGNKPASGTEIIKELGERHLASGDPIVYTSADSVFQIAAHEALIPVGELYRMCQAARALLKPPHNVSRVIARPFIGEGGRFQRTERRRDFSVKPIGETLLDRLSRKDLPVIGIGKIADIFAGCGITQAIHTKNDGDGVDRTLEMMGSVSRGLIFTNLVDFDTLYGHRNDVAGYARALEDLDGRLPELMKALRPQDLLIFSADHGNDPTTPSTDHSREYVPVLITGSRMRRRLELGTRDSFADLGQTLAGIFDVGKLPAGKSFLEDLANVH